MTVIFPKGVNLSFIPVIYFFDNLCKFWFKVYFCNISELNLIPYTWKSSFVYCILKFGHGTSLIPDFNPTQIAFVFPKLGLNPEYFENWKEGKIPSYF